MTFHDHLRVLREQWLAAFLAIVLSAAGATAAFYIKPREYTAQLTMYVSSQGADTTQAAFQGAQLSQDRIASYTELLTGPRVTSDVIARLRLPETTDELADKMKAMSKLDSVLLDVTVTDSDPRRATEIVNTVGLVFPDLVAELERPTKLETPPAVAVRVVQQAQVPDKPSSAGLPLMLALGLLAGLVAGIGCALARNALDTSVRSPEQLRDVVDAPTLGIIAYDADVPKQPLTLHEDPQSPRSEAFRQLRTNLQFVDVDNPRKVIVVTSAIPAEGKTTTTVNLAIALAAAGSRVLLIEADLRRPKIADLLGIDRAVGLTNVLSGRVRAEQAIQPWSMGGLDLMASGPLPPNPSELLASRQMISLLAELRIRYDVVLIDSPPVLPVTDAAAIAPATDGAILVCRFKRTSRTQSQAAADALRAVSAPLLGTVFTMVPSTGPRAYAQYNTYYRTSEVAYRSHDPVGHANRSVNSRHGNDKSPSSMPRPIPRASRAR